MASPKTVSGHNLSVVGARSNRASTIRQLIVSPAPKPTGEQERAERRRKKQQRQARKQKRK